MVYSVEEFNNTFLCENKYTEHIPQYIREYPKFCKMLILFSNYIPLVNSNLEKIIKQLNLDDAHGAVLEKIAQRLNIFIEKPIREDGSVDQNLYEQELRIAIVGNGLKRNSQANRDSLAKLVNVFRSIVKCEITDYATRMDATTKMAIKVKVTGTNDIWSTELLEKYVFPNITGVGYVIQYLLSNHVYFGFDREDIVAIIGSIAYSTQGVSQAALYSKAEELGYTLENRKLKTGTTIEDSEGNGWIFMNSEIGWTNGGKVESGDIVIDSSVGYSIQGWDKGRWAEITVIR